MKTCLSGGQSSRCEGPGWEVTVPGTARSGHDWTGGTWRQKVVFYSVLCSVESFTGDASNQRLF